MMKTNKEKKTNYKKTAWRLMGYVTGTFKVQIVVVFITIIISALAGTAGPLFLMYLIDDFITPLLGQENPNFQGLFQAVIFLGGLYYMGVFCTYIYNYLMVNIGQGVLKRIRDEMFEHMQTLPIKYFDQHPHGELMSLYTNDTDTLRQMISQSLPQVFSAFVTVVAIFLVMLKISWALSVFAIFMVILMVGLTKFIGLKSAKHFIKQQEDLGHINGYVEEMLNGQKVIKVFCHEQETKRLFDELNHNLCDSSTNANKYGNIMMPIMSNLGNLQYVLTAILGGVMMLSNVSGLTLGAIASFLQFTRSFNQPFSQLSQQFNSIIMALAGAERIFKFMDEDSEMDEGYITLVNVKSSTGNDFVESKESTGVWAWKIPQPDGTVNYKKLLGEVRFFDVSFGYNDNKMVLRDMTLYAQTGQKIAFVGSTGAGKTTITNLINRFYDLQAGKILYDGININTIKKADLRRSMGIVLQDTHLFTGTIMENIRYGKLEATDEEVYQAGKLANADQFIQLLPDAYDTVISSDGDNLSQGQRQLLSIARASIANPPVLILDEATSSIDTRTELLVQRGMDGLMKNRTVFVIAHRLSTIRNADAIMVLDHGSIIERGNHTALFRKKGVYHQLYTGALELA